MTDRSIVWPLIVFGLGAALLFIVFSDRVPLADELRLAIVFGLGALFTLTVGVGRLQKARLVEDMPTARVATAAQGYVELIGTAAGGIAEICPIGGEPCLWADARIDTKPLVGDAKAVTHYQRRGSFELQDASGTCRLDVGHVVTEALVWYGAEPTAPRIPDATTRAFTRLFAPIHGGWTAGLLMLVMLLATMSGGTNLLLPFLLYFGAGVLFFRYRYEVRRVRPGDPLYVLGVFRTDEHGVHAVSAGDVDRPFVVSTLSQQALARQSRRGVAPWLAAFLAFMALLGWVLSVYSQGQG